MKLTITHSFIVIIYVNIIVIKCNGKSKYESKLTYFVRYHQIKMKLKIKIFCSSFIFSKKSLWKNLNLITSELNFAEYGKIIPSISDSQNYDANVIMLFHQDIHDNILVEVRIR